MKNAAIAAETMALPTTPKELVDQVFAGGVPLTAARVRVLYEGRLVAHGKHDALVQMQWCVAA